MKRRIQVDKKKVRGNFHFQASGSLFHKLLHCYCQCYEKFECADKHADYGLEKTDIHPNYRNRSEVSFDKCINLKTLYNLYHID